MFAIDSVAKDIGKRSGQIYMIEIKISHKSSRALNCHYRSPWLFSFHPFLFCSVSFCFVLFCFFLCKITFFNGFRLSKMSSVAFQKSAQKYFGQIEKKVVL